jgi:hypothetical protein
MEFYLPSDIIIDTDDWVEIWTDDDCDPNIDDLIFMKLSSIRKIFSKPTERHSFLKDFSFIFHIFSTIMKRINL